MPTRRFTLLVVCPWALVSACGEDEPTGPVTGTLELAISTTGRHLDPSGYTVSVDAAAPAAVPTNGTVILEGVSPGAHELSLADLDENCVPQEPTPIPFSVATGAQTTVTIHVTCVLTSTLAYIKDRTLYLTSAEPGSVPRAIGEDYQSLSWSPDGGTLALVRDLPEPVGPGSSRPWIVFLADADGGHVRQLQELMVTSLSPPLWSPDGKTLLFQSTSRIITGILRMRLDGEYGSFVGGAGTPSECSGLLLSPSWAPDGSRIAVNSYGGYICVFSAEGSFERTLGPQESWGPLWSPNGSLIAFTRSEPVPDGSYSSSIHTIAPDGTNERDLSPAGGPVPRDAVPLWSADGDRLSFVARPEPNSGEPGILSIMDADGGNRIGLTPGGAGTWSPDGARLAFFGEGGLSLIQADGTGLRVLVSGGFLTSYGWRP